MNIIKLLFLSLFLTVSINPVFAEISDKDEVSENCEDQDSHLHIHVFKKKGCAHCEDAEKFFNDLNKTDLKDDFKVFYYDIAYSENEDLFKEVAKKAKIKHLGTPLIFLNEKVILGFGSENTTGKKIKKEIEAGDWENIEMKDFIDGKKYKEDASCKIDDDDCDEDKSKEKDDDEKISVFGLFEINPNDYALPTMSIILGFIDGFNPCAMWVLTTFLIVLMQLKNKKKIFQIVGIFVIAEAVMYYVILYLWLLVFNTFNAPKFNYYIQPAVAILAICAGIFFLWEWRQSDGTCKVTNVKQRAGISKKIKELSSKEMSIIVFLGVIGLAFSVNVIEFACSAGIPQAFTKILSSNSLSVVEEHFYMFLYILFYMIDDLIVFGIALYAIEKIGITQKYAKMSNFIGGILMILIGTILLLKPEILLF